MSNEDVSIIQEINEELKNDKQMEFLKKHKNVIFAVLVTSLVGIVAYLSWHERKKKNMEEITSTLLTIVQDPTSKGSHLIEEMLKSAPAELAPVLLIMESGEKLSTGDFSEKNLKSMLDLSRRAGVDLIWKDLALIIYASYPTQPSAELIKLIEPLTQDGRPFRFTALEIIAMINKNDGNIAEALNCLDKILKNQEAPNTLKKRIEILYNHIKQTMENN